MGNCFSRCLRGSRPTGSSRSPVQPCIEPSPSTSTATATATATATLTHTPDVAQPLQPPLSPPPSIESMVPSTSTSTATLTHTPDVPQPLQPPLSPPPPSIESMVKSMKESMHKDPTHQIDVLIEFIDNRLSTAKGPQEQAASSSSSSGVQLEDVSSTLRSASQLIDNISTEAGNLEKSEIAKVLGSVALRALKAAGEAHWIGLGLSMVASTVETYVKAGSNYEECRDLLDDIVSLAKKVKDFREALPEKIEETRKAVSLIVEGAVMCSSYMAKGKFHRFWSATTQETQLQKTRECLRDVISFLDLTVNVDTRIAVHQMKRQLTQDIHQSPLNLLTFHPGIDDQVEKVKKMVDMEGSDPAIAIILCGTGGFGKSTLAESVIQQLNWSSTDYKFCMVRINQEATDRVSHIVKLQQEIIHGLGGPKLGFTDPAKGRYELQQVMESKSSFLFIDNVVDKYYIQELLPEDLLGGKQQNASLEKTMENKQLQKSNVRILITCRENNLGPILNSKKCHICREHRVNHLCNEAAKRLLRGKILGGESENQCKPHNFPEEEDYMDQVAKACKGVPLLLAVFGKYLAVKRDADSYRQALAVLQQGLPDNFTDEEHLSQRLLFVYDKMENKEAQEAFLDICTYFHGWEWELVGHILDKDNVEHLRNKMLVEKSDTGTVIVHDVLKSLGINEAKQTRISNYDELSPYLKHVKGISIVGDTSLITVQSTHFIAMCQDLRVLQLGDWVTLDGLLDERAFKHLRYLHVGDIPVFPFKDVRRLEKLKYFSNKSKGGMELPELPPTLKFLSHQATHLDPIDLGGLDVQTHKSVKLPTGLKLPASLVTLDLSSCTQLPKTLNHLTALERLILDKCDMESLPHGFGKLNKLKHLSMENCTKLTSLPAGFGSLHSLIYLNLRGCTSLKELPDEFIKLSSLKDLNIEECQSLSTLFKDWGSISSLQKLDLAGCIKLQRLPESLWSLPVDSLTLEDLHCLEELPQHTTKNIPCLTSLILRSCRSLTTLPNSIVHFTKLETLKIVDCIKIEALPGNFGQLISLKEMLVENCPRLKELPNGFELLPALKILTLKSCSSLVNLPKGFGELPSLENLCLYLMPLSSLPDGFEKLKRLEKLNIDGCNKVEGPTMERMVTSQRCWWISIDRSSELEKWWEENQKDEHLMMVYTSRERLIKSMRRAERVAFFGGEYKEVNSGTYELIECPPENTIVAVIRLPIHMEERHRGYLEGATWKAMETARTECSGQLTIIYAKNVSSVDQMQKKEDENEEEEKRVEEILKSVPTPKGSSYVIPSTHITRLSLIQRLVSSDDGKFAVRLLRSSLHDEGKIEFWEIGRASEDDFPKDWSPDFVKEENEIPNEESSEGVFEEDETAQAVDEEDGYSLVNSSNLQSILQHLKEKNMNHFIHSNKPMALEQLEGKEVCLIVSGLKYTVECIMLQKIYKDFQLKNFHFEWVWIPVMEDGDYGFGSYTRAIQCMPWATLPHPKSLKIKEKSSRCIMFDKEGNNVKEVALSLMISWGTMAYPFTEDKINEIVSDMASKSSLEFLYEEMDFLGSQGSKMQVKKELINNKLIFLYAEPPSQNFKMKSKLDQLLQNYEDFEILYVGNFFDMEEKDVGALKEVYEDATKNMQWPKLSFWDMIKFWYRCKYLSNEVKGQLNVPSTLQRLVNYLYIEKRWLVFLDCDGIITGSGKEVVEMICKSNNENADELDIMIKEGLMQSLKTGKCHEILRVFFRDELSNYPHHPEHSLFLRYSEGTATCDICSSEIGISQDQKRAYRCEGCDFDICRDCWEAFAKQQVKDLSPTKDIY